MYYDGSGNYSTTNDINNLINTDDIALDKLANPTSNVSA